MEVSSEKLSKIKPELLIASETRINDVVSDAVNTALTEIDRILGETVADDGLANYMDKYLKKRIAKAKEIKQSESSPMLDNDFVKCLEIRPLPPDDFDTEDGKQAFIDAVIEWYDTSVADVLMKAGKSPFC